jgi:hypothetical protein
MNQFTTIKIDAQIEATTLAEEFGRLEALLDAEIALDKLRKEQARRNRAMEVRKLAHAYHERVAIAEWQRMA